MPTYVNHTGTYNVYRLDHVEDGVRINLEMYGIQTVRVVGVQLPAGVSSSNPFLQIVSFDYDPETSVLDMQISGRDMQGERGTIRISY